MTQVVFVSRTTLAEGTSKEEYEAWANVAVPEIAMEFGASMVRRMWSRTTPNLHTSSYVFETEEAWADADQNKRPAVLERVNAQWGDKVTREFELYDSAQFVMFAPTAKTAAAE